MGKVKVIEGAGRAVRGALGSAAVPEHYPGQMEAI